MIESQREREGLREKYEIERRNEEREREREKGR